LTLRVLYFASLRDRAGRREETIDVPPGTRVLELWELLVARHPPLREVTVRPMAACDLAYAPWDLVLDGVAEVAFLPPVSGG